MSRLRLAAVALAFISLASCEEAPLTAPNGSTIFLQANPGFVIANGGISVVTAVVTEPAGTFVPDGTEVFFFTTLGRIDQTGKTVRGIARVNFVSDSRSGRATVTAISGQAGATNPTVEIAIGSALPSRVNVAADPQRLTTQRNARIVATVFDEFGNPVQNVPVSFSIDGSLVEETLDSGGALLYTNSNGQVSDTLRTQAPIGLGQKDVTVTATTANGITGSVTLFID
ncbi:MAG TPA: hypothetical protein VJ648_00705 [Vicinamibacteria bacterium]|nr:hypothetical protein [Vicinamibacteria bacterium]